MGSIMSGCAVARSSNVEREEFVVPKHDLIFYSQSKAICTLTLVSGWDDAMSMKVKSAITSVMETNPFLSAMLKKRDDGEVVCEAGHHHDPLVEVTGPDNVGIPTSTGKAIALLHELEPLFAEHDLGNLAQALETGGPLFRIVIMRLNSGLAVLAPYLNHTLADGCTYYMVCEAIDAAANDRPLPMFQWRAAERDVCIPSGHSSEDAELTMSGWIPGFMENMARYEPGTDSERVVAVKEIDQEGVQKLKNRFHAAAQAQGLEFLGTNDFLMAGMSELYSEEWLMIMFANMRKRMPGVTTDMAGNYERPVFAPAAKDPMFWRSIQKHWAYFGIEGNPNLSSPNLKESVTACNIGFTTNWTSLTRFIQPTGAKVLGHCCTKGFIAAFPGLDGAVVFKGDAEGAVFYMDNFTAGKRGEELKESIQKSEIFGKLFQVEPLPLETEHMQSEERQDIILLPETIPCRRSKY